MGISVRVWSVHMHFKVKGFKIITLHSNFFCNTSQKEKFCIGRFVLNMKLIWCLTILKKYMHQNDTLKLFRFPTQCTQSSSNSKRQSPSLFGRFPIVKNYSSIHILHRMTLASMHPIFQVSIEFCDHSSPNYVWKIHVHIQLCLPSRSCSQCQVEVAELKLPSMFKVEIAWVIGSMCQDWSPTMFLFANYKHCILWQAIFGETFIVTSGNFVEHIFCEVPKKLFDGQNGILQVLKTSILNSDRNDLSTTLRYQHPISRYG